MGFEPAVHSGGAYPPPVGPNELPGIIMFNVYLSLGIFIILIKMAKKKYSYSKKGKFYTYAKVNRMLAQYDKAKFSTTLLLKWSSADDYGYNLRPLYNPSVKTLFCTMSSQFSTCAAYESYRNLYAAFKVRGVLIEAIPFSDPIPYVNNGSTFIPWNGAVAIGMFPAGSGDTLQEQNETRKSFKDIVDSDKGLLLDPKNRQRKYCSYNTADFLNFPLKPFPTEAAYVPLVLHCNYEQYSINTYVNHPEWYVKLT